MIEHLSLADLCTGSNLATLSPDDPVVAAVRMMGERRVSSVVVVRDGRPLGIFTESDALRLLVSGDYDPSLPLRERMSADLLTAPPETSFVDGYATMSAGGCRHLVLVDAQGQLRGLVSETDFAHALGAEELLTPRHVADLMTRDPLTLPPAASVAEALSLMSNQRVSSIVIADAGRALGVISERDAIRLAAANLNPQTTPIADVMSTPVHTIGPDRPAHEASPRMRALGIRRLIVTDEQEQLLGILTRRDLLKDIQDVYVRLLRRVVVVQGEALSNARRELGQHSILRSLLEHSEHLGIILADADQGIQLTNEAALEALGITAQHARTLDLMGLLSRARLTSEEQIGRLAALSGSQRLVLDLSRGTGREKRRLRLVASAVNDEVGNREGYLVTIQDSTDEHAARQQQRLINTLFENTKEGILITDVDNRILAVNPAFTAITGYSAAEAIGQNPRMLSSGRHPPAFYRALWDELHKNGCWNGEVWNRRKNGEIYPQWLNITQVRGPNGDIQQHLAIFSDGSAARRSAEEIEYLSHHDPLTGLFNLARLRVRLAETLEQAAAAQHRLALMVLDLDRFSDLVASQGHLTGDEVLKAIADRLAHAISPTDILARLAGDRFVIARPLDGPSDAAVRAVQAAQTLQQLVQRTLELTDLPELTLTATVGVALYPEDGAGVTTLLRNAESALSQAKQSGRGGLAFYRPELTQEARRRVQIEQELRRALSKGELRLFYQPIVAIATGAVVAAEALLRWEHPSDGLLTPRDFIAAVEHSELVEPIGRWVLEQAILQASAWLPHGRVRVNVNVAGAQITSGNLALDIEEILKRTGGKPRLLGIEVLERVLLRDPDLALAELDRIRALGVAIALDDFGSGYSSLSYLKRLPVDTLKIDQGFIRHLSSDPVDEAIVCSTINMAHNLGLRVVAEGVEHADQLSYLASIGCDLAQGYLIGRPGPAEAITAMLRAARETTGGGQP
ncbi:MAG: EAL domain-containing protein [Sphingobacteriia bacterium]|nr:EAL domain-containing protein [Sphingobacteriia bacterium]NCC39893.1 EAL domain-containing protein [Gammaproteobacteria bacterium]